MMAITVPAILRAMAGGLDRLHCSVVCQSYNGII